MVTPRRELFAPEKENNKDLQNFANECNVILLAIIAPFTPAKVSPKRVVFAQLLAPEEFMMEEFVQLVEEKYPDKAQRPTLYLLLHTPGGGVTSAYMIASVLRESFNKIVGIVPHQAASGGTVIALSCNELILGRISQLTSIDPYESNGDYFFAASELSAFSNLVQYFEKTSYDDAPYPWVHLANQITPQRFDRATRLMGMVNKYVTQLLSGAGYEEDKVKEIIGAFLWQTNLHEEVFRYKRLQELLGKNAKLYTEDDKSKQIWNLMRTWLKSYYMQPSPIHIVRYVLPSTEEVKDVNEEVKNE